MGEVPTGVVVGEVPTGVVVGEVPTGVVVGEPPTKKPTPAPESRVNSDVLADPTRTGPFVAPTREPDSETGSMPISRELNDKQEAHDVAERIIDAKIEEIKQKYTKGGQVDTASMSASEFNTYSIYILYQKGFTKSEYRDNPHGIPLFNGEGVQITKENAEGEATSTTVFAVKEQRVDRRGRIVEYVCYTDPTDTTKIITVKPGEITKGFIDKASSSIADSVEPGQKPLVEWYARGEKGVPPHEVVKKENDPMTQANRVITKRIQELRTGIEALDKKERGQREATIAKLEFALKSEGEEWGAFVKMDALKKIGADKRGTADGKTVETVMGALDKKAEQAKVNLLKSLNEAGVSQKVINEIQTNGLEVVFKNDKLMKQFLGIPNVEQKLFGINTPSDAEVDAMADAHLNPEQKAALTEAGGKKGIILAILLAILATPLLIGAASVAATSGLAKTLGAGQ